LTTKLSSKEKKIQHKGEFIHREKYLGALHRGTRGGGIWFTRNAVMVIRIQKGGIGRRCIKRGKGRRKKKGSSASQNCQKGCKLSSKKNGEGMVTIYKKLQGFEGKKGPENPAQNKKNTWGKGHRRPGGGETDTGQKGASDFTKNQRGI